MWRPVAIVLCLAVVLLLPWRRTHPLAVVAAAFGAVTAVSVAALVGADEPVGLDTTVCVVLLHYSLFRWGSGREAAIGLAIILVAAVVGFASDSPGVADVVFGTMFLLFPAALGASVRFRGTARLRELDQVKLREREQLARELHDTVAHHVSAIAIQAQAGRTVAGADPAAAVRALEVIEEEASRTLAEMRTMVGALREGEDAELAPQPWRRGHRAPRPRRRARAAGRRGAQRRPPAAHAVGGGRDVSPRPGVDHERAATRPPRDPHRRPWSPVRTTACG